MENFRIPNIPQDEEEAEYDIFANEESLPVEVPNLDGQESVEQNKDIPDYGPIRVSAFGPDIYGKF
jgi:hypothetical protein